MKKVHTTFRLLGRSFSREKREIFTLSSNSPEPQKMPEVVPAREPEVQDLGALKDSAEKRVAQGDKALNEAKRQRSSFDNCSLDTRRQLTTGCFNPAGAHSGEFLGNGRLVGGILRGQVFGDPTLDQVSTPPIIPRDPMAKDQGVDHAGAEKKEIFPPVQRRVETLSLNPSERTALVTAQNATPEFLETLRNLRVSLQQAGAAEYNRLPPDVKSALQSADATVRSLLAQNGVDAQTITAAVPKSPTQTLAWIRRVFDFLGSLATARRSEGEQRQGGLPSIEGDNKPQTLVSRREKGGGTEKPLPAKPTPGETGVRAESAKPRPGEAVASSPRGGETTEKTPEDLALSEREFAEKAVHELVGHLVQWKELDDHIPARAARDYNNLYKDEEGNLREYADKDPTKENRARSPNDEKVVDKDDNRQEKKAFFKRHDIINQLDSLNAQRKLSLSTPRQRDALDAIVRRKFAQEITDLKQTNGTDLQGYADLIVEHDRYVLRGPQQYIASAADYYRSVDDALREEPLPELTPDQHENIRNRLFWESIPDFKKENFDEASGTYTGNLVLQRTTPSIATNLRVLKGKLTITADTGVDSTENLTEVSQDVTIERKGPFKIDHLTYVGASFVADNTMIESVPDGLTVDGNFSMSKSSVKKISNLTVGGNFYMDGCTFLEEITSLTATGSIDLHNSNKLKVLRTSSNQCVSLDCSGSYFLQTIEGLQSVAGDANFRGCGQLSTLPNGFSAGTLNIRDCKALKSLPTGLTVRGDVDAFGSGIETIPDGVYISGDLDATFTDLETIPPGATINGKIYCYQYSKLTKLAAEGRNIRKKDVTWKKLANGQMERVVSDAEEGTPKVNE